MNYLWIYLAAVNLLTFSLFGLDKLKARNRQRRIPERTLLFLAVIGGSVGALAGMGLFRHKTRKTRFSVGIPVILMLQVLAMAGYYLI